MKLFFLLLNFDDNLNVQKRKKYHLILMKTKKYFDYFS